MTSLGGIVNKRFPARESLCKEFPNEVPDKSLTGMSTAERFMLFKISFFLKGKRTVSQASRIKLIFCRLMLEASSFPPVVAKGENADEGRLGNIKLDDFPNNIPPVLRLEIDWIDGDW